jgi:predicted DNA-binding protein (MmcQ/YjbR family)
MLRTFALGFPEAYEDFPWGDHAFKVRKKIFLFLGADGELLTVTVKLPGSAAAALALPLARPTAYGLGKSGWITLRISAADVPPLDLLRDWIDESYRTVAPKTLVKMLG